MSYDTVARSYADLLRDSIAQDRRIRGVLALFAEMAEDPVVDVGCGPGWITAHLRDRGLRISGIDLSPGMIEIARANHPGINFDVGSMTDLALPDESVGGVLAFFSVIHVPDESVPTVLAHFHRVLRPGGVAMIGFHVGDSHKLKTEGYGGHPMQVYVHRRTMTRMADWARAAGFVIEAEIILWPDGERQGGVLVASRPEQQAAGGG